MLMELIIAVIILVALQTLVGLALMRAALSKRFLKWYTKKAVEIATEVTNEMVKD